MNESLKKKAPVIIRAFLVFAVVYVALTAVFYVSSQYITEQFLPVFAYIIERVYPENELVSLGTKRRGGNTTIRFNLKVNKQVEGFCIPLVEELSGSIDSSIQFVTLIIFYPLLISWPLLSPRKKAKAFLLSFPFLTLFVFIDIPVNIIGTIEQEYVLRLEIYPMVDITPSKTFPFLSHFFSNGGRQFFAVILFALTIIPFHNQDVALPGSQATSRNVPCPSGSGKKYKKCCMK